MIRMVSTHTGIHTIVTKKQTRTFFRVININIYKYKTIYEYIQSAISLFFVTKRS